MMFDKYRDKTPSQLIKLLFHGSGRGGAQPQEIYRSEEGLDFRFSKVGMFGMGTYFADNSAYSHAYTYQDQEENITFYYMFVCFVLPGDSAKNPANPRELRLPPHKPDGVERYDTVQNNDGTHTVTYKNSKSYPAYLIKYTV